MSTNYCVVPMDTVRLADEATDCDGTGTALLFELVGHAAATGENAFGYTDFLSTWWSRRFQGSLAGMKDTLELFEDRGIIVTGTYSFSLAGWDGWQAAAVELAAQLSRSSNCASGALRRWHNAGKHTTPKAGCELCEGGVSA